MDSVKTGSIQGFCVDLFDYERYRVYSYQGGNEIAKYVSLCISKQLAMLEKRLDYQMEEKINVLVFTRRTILSKAILASAATIRII